jgi:hypothetical protein
MSGAGKISKTTPCKVADRRRHDALRFSEQQLTRRANQRHASIIALSVKMSVAINSQSPACFSDAACAWLSAALFSIRFSISVRPIDFWHD